MDKKIDAFTIITEENIDNLALFDIEGNLIGRLLKKGQYPNNQEYYYDYETSPETLKKILDGTIAIEGIENYTVRKCITSWRFTDGKN